MQINITLLKMLSIYSLLYTVVHFIWLFGNFSKCVFSRAKLAHLVRSRLKFQGHVFEVGEKSYAGQLRWLLSSKHSFCPVLRCLGGLCCSLPGLQCTCCLCKPTGLGLRSVKGQLQDQKSTQAATCPHCLSLTQATVHLWRIYLPAN